MSDDCLFCRIVAGEIPAAVVIDNDKAMAFRDIDPKAPTHVLVIPHAHHATVAELAQAPEDLTAVMRVAAAVADTEGIADGGWRLVFNTGEAAGQSVHHVHGHVLGGRALTWPPG